MVSVPERALPIWTLLHDETVAIHACWKLFNQLFGGPQDQLDVLNRSAGFCFYVIQDALTTDIQLTLSKLSDPAESRGKTNATAEHLLDEIRDLRTPACVDGLHGLLQTFIDACKPIREARNKMVAHLDRATALKMDQVKSVPRTTVAQVEAALRALRNFMNAAAEYLGQAPTAYEHFITRGEGAMISSRCSEWPNVTRFCKKRGRFRGMMCRTAESARRMLNLSGMPGSVRPVEPQQPAS